MQRSCKFDPGEYGKCLESDTVTPDIARDIAKFYRTLADWRNHATSLAMCAWWQSLAEAKTLGERNA